MTDHKAEATYHPAAGYPLTSCPTCHALLIAQLGAVTGHEDWHRATGTTVAGRSSSVATCPRCGRVSYNPADAERGYCGACHDYTGTPSDVATQANTSDERH